MSRSDLHAAAVACILEHMTTTASLTDQTPAEVDAELARIWAAQNRAKATASSLRRSIAQQRYPHLKAESERQLATTEILQAELQAEAAPYEAEWSARRWNRYFLVTNSNGHVHRNLVCSTCFLTTEYAWLPELSGCDEAAMIEEFGEKACTVCFPDAPANPSFHGPGRRDAAAKAERDAERAAKRADKDAKAITDVDGSPLRSGYGIIRTKVAARNELSQAVQSYGWYGPTHPSDFLAEAKKLVAALDAAGIETRPVIERAIKKSAKEGAEHLFPIGEALA